MISRSTIETMMATGNLGCDFLKNDAEDIEWLLTMNTRNRNVEKPSRQAQINRIAADMSRGDFIPTGQGISISVDGVLLDAQGRLLAAKKAMADGAVTTVTILVAVGIEARAILVIDRDTVSRTLVDSAVLSGRTEITPAHQAALHGMFELSHKVYTSKSNQEQIRLFDRHRPAIDDSTTRPPHMRPGKSARSSCAVA